MRSFAILASLVAGASADGAVQPFFLQSASDIASLDDLNHWKLGAQADILKLPQDRQSLMLMSLEREYKQRLSQMGSSAAAATESDLPAFLVLESAHRYHTMEELQAWRQRQSDEIKKMPAEYQHYGYDSVAKEFESRKAALQQDANAEATVTSFSAVELPVLKLNAEEFTSTKDLDMWHSEQLAQIEAFVPQGYRSFATDTVEAEYKSRAGQLREAAPIATGAAAELQEAGAGAAAKLREAGVQPLFLRSASHLNTAELESWLTEEQRHVQEAVPEEQQRFMLDSVQQEYEQRLGQLSGQVAGELPAFLVLESAHRYHTLPALESWRARQVDHISHDVPFEYQPVGLDSVKKEYLKRKAQLEQGVSETPAPQEQPVLMLTAEEFQNKAQLDEWRQQQKTTIDEHVPKNYRKYAVQSIDREYEKRITALEEANRTAALEADSTAATESSSAVEADNSSAPEPLDEEQLVEEAERPSRFHAGNIVLAMSTMVLPMTFFVAAVVAGFRRQHREGADEPLLAQPEDNA